MSKPFEHTDEWTPSCLVDNIFNDLMEKSIEGKNGNRINKYINQAIEKFQYFRIKSPVTFFDITIDDLSTETKKHLNDYVKDLSSESKIYQKLNGIMTENIAMIFKQAESLIISCIEFEDLMWTKNDINSIRELVSSRWKLI